jgi:hypothetical protein
MSVTHLLIHTATVERNTPIDIGQGKWRDNYAPLHTNIRFRISGLSASERRTADQLKTYAEFAGYAEPGLDIKKNDQVTGVVREDGSVDPNTYQVMGDVQPSIAHHTKVLLRVIKLGTA